MWKSIEILPKQKPLVTINWGITKIWHFISTFMTLDSNYQLGFVALIGLLVSFIVGELCRSTNT